MSTILTLALALFAAECWAQSGDWPTYRHNNARTGAAAHTLQLPLVPIWSYVAPEPPILANTGPQKRVVEGYVLRPRQRFDDVFHVAVVGNRVFFGSSVDDQLHCRDAETGELLWSFTTGAAIRLAPTVWDGRVYFGSDDGFAYCLTASDGTVVWKTRAGPADEWMIGRQEMVSRWPVRSGVLVEDGIAYFTGGIFPYENIYLHAVDAQTGETRWMRDDISIASANRNDLAPQGYLLADATGLIVPSSRSLPAVFDRANGDLLFKADIGRSSAGGVNGGTQAVLADGQVYSWAADHIFPIRRADGKLGTGFYYGREITFSGPHAYVADGESIAKIERAKYADDSVEIKKLEWEITTTNRALLHNPDDPKADDHRSEIAKRNEQIENLRKNSTIWRVDATPDSSLIVAGDVLLAGGRSRVFAYDTASGELRWNVEIDGEARGLAVANGHLYVSTTSGRIVCFGQTPGTKHEAVTHDAREGHVPFPDNKHAPLCRQAAERILNETGIRRGFCLVAGSEDGRLAYELAKQSDLTVYGIEPDASKVAEARRRLIAAGLYGTRVIIHQGDLDQTPYPSYFANLIVSDTLLRTGRMPGAPQQIARHLKPVGGVICLGRPERNGAAVDTKNLTEWLQRTGLTDHAAIATNDSWTTLTRGKLPGAGSWTHQYGDSGNTACGDDLRIKGGGLGVLWYGDPGEGQIVNRHEGAVGPLSAGGRLFVQGEKTIMAYDAYNGLFLWERPNPETIRTGVFRNENPGNLVVSDDNLFYMSRDACHQLDAATGRLITAFGLPETKDAKNYQWGYVAYQDGLLLGTATVREEIQQWRRRRGKATIDATDAIFAIDVGARKHLWTYQGQNIMHHTIALGPDRVFFVDSSISSDERAALLRQDKTDLEFLEGEERERAEERLKNADVRMTIALDARTGEKVWSQPVDVTDCSDIGIGGGKLTLIHKEGVLILCGANANGHYWRQFMAGEFSRRRLVALSAADGYKLWAKDANYRHRPIIVGNRVIAEPWSFELQSGEQEMRQHPLTGKSVPWSIMRSGHHCGMLTATENTLMFRSGFTSFYDLDGDGGTLHFAGHRTGCWVNAIPANGLVLIPESSAGCVCLFSLSSTIVLEPRPARRPWGIFSAVGAATPVDRMTLNLGAPGDRRADDGTLWLAYPRPRPSRATSLDLPLDLQEEFHEPGRYFADDSAAIETADTDTPWLYTSGAIGLRRCTLTLLGESDSPAEYTVRLHLVERNASHRPGDCTFDILVQGKSAVSQVEIREHDSARIRVIEGVSVEDNLTIELNPTAACLDDSRIPSLCAIEVVRIQAEPSAR